MNKIALTMIARGKNEEEQLQRALSSVSPFVDGIFITLTSPTNELKEAERIIKSFERPDCPIHISYGEFQWIADKESVDWLKKFLGYEPHMKVGDKIFQFDRARNFNISQVPKEYNWMLWIDSDDVFRGGENLHKLSKMCLEQNIEALYFNYIYQAEFDEQGNIKHRIIEHLRERVIRNNGHFKWISPIHETLIEQVPTQKTDTSECDVVHMASRASRLDSLTRNLKNLELAIIQTNGKDPRHTYYLAKAYFDKAHHLNEMNFYEKAIPLLEKYLTGEHKSGWPEERGQACEYLCEIYRKKNDHSKALVSCLRALEEPCEPSPSVYVNLALCWVMLQNWELAMYWVRLATMMPDQKTTLIKSVKDIQGRVLEIIYNAQLNLHKIDESWAAAKKMIELFPEEENVKKAYQFIDELRTQRDLVVNVGKLANFLAQHGEMHKIKPLLAAVPRLIEQTPFIQDMYIKNMPPTAWGENEIAIYCGPGFTQWSPKTLNDPNSFIGGSEEAVIEMSKELAKIGWKVTVYGSVLENEEYDGVKYIPYYKFNALDNFNILIVWRQIGFFDQEVKAKKTYLWNHDFQNSLEYNENRVKRINKVLFLSKWHRDNVESLPEEKVMITSNGI